MTKKIEKLTPEQEKLIPVVRDEWVRFCLSGDSTVDKKEARDGVLWQYALSKQNAPRFIAFAGGPLAAQMIANVFPSVLEAIHIKKPRMDSVRASVVDSVGDSVAASVRASMRALVGDSVVDSVRASVVDSVWASVMDSVVDPVGDSVVDSVWASVRASVRALVGALVGDSVVDSVRASVRASVWDSVRDSVRASVWDSVRASVRASVGDSVMDSVRASVGDSVRASVWASVWDSVWKHEVPWNGCGDDSGWGSWFDFFNRIGVKNENGERYLEWLKSGVWDVLWFKDLAVMTCRPSSIKKDERGHLHCSDGPAAKWPSGEEYFFWHGTQVNEKIIMRPRDITKEDIEDEKNSEVSRAIAERLGWDEYMERAETFLVDKWFDADKSLHYELWDFKKRFERTPKLLKMESPETKDGTRPHYVEPVDPGLKTCQAARAWQFMKTDGEWPTVDECNKNPEMRFQVEA